jgi:pimeloyl-ACP methyl ester carboxylesterase
MTMKKPSLLLIPGLLCTRDLWAAQIKALCHQVDIQVADTTQHDSVQALATSILARAPEKFAMAGLSMGGYIAFEIFRQAPQRIKKLALMDTRAATDLPEQLARRRDFVALAKRGKFRGVTPVLLPGLIHKDNLDNEPLKRTIFRMAHDVGRDAFIRQQQAIITRPDSQADLARIQCPTLVLCGEGDTLTPVGVHREMAATIPGAKLVIVEGAGHLPPLEQPETVTRHMREWLELA